jgi:hypothetical protein
LHVHFPTQTVAWQVHDGNQIGADVAQHSADAIPSSTVRFIVVLTFPIHMSLLTQAVPSVNLNWNNIGDKGTKTLADTLQNDKVRESFPCFFSLAVSFRHTDRYQTRT